MTYGITLGELEAMVAEALDDGVPLETPVVVSTNDGKDFWTADFAEAWSMRRHNTFHRNFSVHDTALDNVGRMDPELHQVFFIQHGDECGPYVLRDMENADYTDAGRDD